MLKRKVFYSVPVIAMLGTVSQDVSAQDRFLIDAGPCLSITRAVERFQCLESQINAAGGQSLTGEVGSPNRPAPPASVSPNRENLPVVSVPNTGGNRQAELSNDNVPQNAVTSSEDSFGLEEGSFGRNGREEMLGVVAEVRELNRNRKVITLANGQVWQQKNTQQFILESGDEVRIYSQVWGKSYRLSSTSHNGFITVDRVR